MLASEQRWATAYHEAGHIVLACITGRIPVSATIAAAGPVKGKVEFDRVKLPPEWRPHFSRPPGKQQYVEYRVMGELAGTIGHDIGFPARCHDEGDHHDRALAMSIIEESAGWEDDRDAYLHRLERRARALLAERRHLVDAVAQALIERETLTRGDILALVPSEFWLATDPDISL